MPLLHHVSLTPCFFESQPPIQSVPLISPLPCCFSPAQPCCPLPLMQSDTDSAGGLPPISNAPMQKTNLAGGQPQVCSCLILWLSRAACVSTFWREEWGGQASVSQVLSSASGWAGQPLLQPAHVLRSILQALCGQRTLCIIAHPHPADVPLPGPAEAEQPGAAKRVWRWPQRRRIGEQREHRWLQQGHAVQGGGHEQEATHGRSKVRGRHTQHHFQGEGSGRGAAPRAGVRYNVPLHVYEMQGWLG